MPKFSRLYCNLVDHKVDRHRVWHDRMNYRTTCSRCREPLIRVHNGWREFSADADYDARRVPHPEP